MHLHATTATSATRFLKLKLLRRARRYSNLCIKRSGLLSSFQKQPYSSFPSMIISVQDEIVDDSEPEREELRRRERKITKVISPKRAPKLFVSHDVIEITDDEEFDNHPHNLQTKFNQTSMETIPTTSNPLTSSHAPTNFQIRSSPLHDSNDNGALSRDDDSGDEVKLNVKHFAYTNPTKIKPSRAIPDNISTETKPARKKRSPAAHSFFSDFSGADLTKVKKCVSCEVNWTTRKTGSQKMLHIQACGKKNGFTEETIRVLIQKEIDAAADRKGTSKTIQVFPVQPTFFEDIITDATRKKKGRRIEIAETVQSVSVARTAILDRARAVLGSSGDHSKSQDEVRIIHTQSVGGIIPGDGPTPATQAFGQSALGQTHLHSKSILSQPSEFLEEISESEAIDTTQVFAPSKLGALARATQIEPSQKEIRDTQVLAHSDFPSGLHTGEFPFLLANTDTYVTSQNVSARDPGRSQALRSDDKGDMKDVHPDQILDTEANGQCDDQVYLHFDPKMESGAPPVNKKYQTIPLTDKLTAGAHRKPKENSSSRFKPAVDVVLNMSAPAKTPKKTKGKQEEQYGGNWEATMKERLMQDRSLHLRILRYEPIHFDTFLKLASDGHTHSGKLKTQLRLFLDRQAINFYGADPTGRRR